MTAGRALLLETGLALVLLFSPLVFGLVYSWAVMPVAALIFFLFMVFPGSTAEIFRVPRPARFGMSLTAILLFAQLLFSSHQKYETGVEILKWTAALALFLLIQRLPAASVPRLMFFLVVAAAGEAVYGLVEVKSGREMVLWHAKESYQGFVTGTYFNRNHFAGFLELCLGVHLGLLMKYARQRNVPVLCGLVFLLGITLTAFIQTGSRMGIFSFAAAALILTFGLKQVRQKPVFSSFILLLAAGAVIFGGKVFLARFDFSEGFRNFDGGRVVFWQSLLMMLKSHLWFGTGLGTFDWVLPQYQSENFLLGWLHAHNDYLELAIELGIPGFLICTASFFCAILFLFRRLQAFDSSKSPLLWGCLFSLISLIFHGFCDFNFAIPANVFLFVFILGLAFRLERGDAHE